MGNLPGVNYDSKLSVDDLSFQAEKQEEAILDRTTLVFGGGSLLEPKYGIVDSVNPQDLVSSETTRPLVVYASTSNPLRVNVSVGSVVTPNGCLVSNPVLIEDMELARTVANDVIVVFLENEIVDSDPVRITRYNVSQYVRKTQSEDTVRSALLSDYNNSVLFTPARKENIVVIAVIKVAETVSGLELQIDYTNSAYSFNRPWYSPVDIEHRSKIGTGSATDKNPHGTSYNDLTSGPLTLYDQILPFGVIQSRDADIKGVPGTSCKETITTSRVLTDISGSYTSESRFGGPGKNYIVLAQYPVWVSSFYLESHKGHSVAFDWIPGTRIVVLPDTLSSTGVIEYNTITALSPPTSVLSNKIVFSQPDETKEIVYTGGVSLSSLTSNTIDFDGSGPVPRNYTVFTKSDGTLLKSPELIQTPFLLDDLGTILTPITYTYFGPAQISIGLADANTVSTMSVVIRVYGKDSNGSSISEDLTFSGSSWTHVPLPGVETPSQFLRTEQVFYSVTNIQVISRTDDGPNSRIVMWAELETGTAVELNKLAIVASMLWNGQAVNNIRDLRQVTKVIPSIGNRFQSVGEIQGPGGTEPLHVLTEDFLNPRFRDVATGYQEATQATFSIFVDDYTLIQSGDQIQFPNLNTITAITSGVPNRAIGQYKSSISNQDTRDDMILTINDLTFNSGVLAEPDSFVNRQVNCTMAILGSRGNGSVTEPVQANPTAITLSTGGAMGGIDSYGESYHPHNADGINTPLPSVLTYDVEDVRGKYRSRAIPVGNKQRISIFIHGAKNPFNNLQLRARVALSGDPVWKPWEVITGSGIFFTFTKALPITKVQLEIFGRCSGYTLLEGDI